MTTISRRFIYIAGSLCSIAASIVDVMVVALDHESPCAPDDIVTYCSIVFSPPLPHKALSVVALSNLRPYIIVSIEAPVVYTLARYTVLSINSMQSEHVSHRTRLVSTSDYRMTLYKNSY